MGKKCQGENIVSGRKDFAGEKIAGGIPEPRQRQGLRGIGGVDRSGQQLTVQLSGKDQRQCSCPVCNAGCSRRRWASLEKNDFNSESSCPHG